MIQKFCESEEKQLLSLHKLFYEERRINYIPEIPCTLKNEFLDKLINPVRPALFSLARPEGGSEAQMPKIKVNIN